MDKNITQFHHKLPLSDLEAQQNSTTLSNNDLQPAPSVLKIIKQFARCYKYDTRLPHQLASMSAN